MPVTPEQAKALKRLSKLAEVFRQTKNDGDRATRDQAIGAAAQAGASDEEISNAAGMPMGAVKRISKNYPFASRRKIKNRGDLGLPE